MSPIYDEITETENKKNEIYEHPNFKPPDVAKFQPYERLDKASMK